MKRWFDGSDKKIIGLGALLFVLSLVPLFLVEMAPIADLPNHLARAHILRTGGTDAYLNQFYDIAWGVLPNLLMDLLIVLLDFVPLYPAGNILIGLSFFCLLLGVFMLRRSLYGSLSILALLACLLLYNRMLLWGMLNYMFGVGLMLIGLALWIRLRGDSAVKRIAISSGMAMLVFLGHLFPFGLYALAVGAYELQDLLRSKNRNIARWRHTILVGGVQFIMPVFAFFFLSPTAEYTVSRLAFGDFSRKLLTVPFMTFNNYNLTLDVVSFFLVGGLVLFLLIRSVLVIKHQMIGVILLLTVVHFAMPQYLLSSPGADLRTFLPLLFICIASVDIQQRNSRVVLGLASAFAALFLVRLTVVAENWVWADRTVLPEYRQAFDQLPVGAKVGSYFYLHSDKWFVNPPHQHYPALAIIEKSSFVPILFAHPGQQPVHFTAGYQPVAMRAPALMVSSAAVAVRPDPADQTSLFWACRFVDIEYLMISNARDSHIELPGFLTPVYQGRHVSLFAVLAPELEAFSIHNCPAK